MFIELVEVREGATNHTEFLKTHGEGLQHLAFSVENMNEILERLKTEGVLPILQYEFETVFNGKPMQVHEVYLNTNKFVGGTTVQLLEMSPASSAG